MSPIPFTVFDQWLGEEIPDDDVTTQGLSLAAEPAVMTLSSRSGMVAAGLETAADLIRAAGGQVRVTVPSGAWVPASTPLLIATGRAAALLASRRGIEAVVEVCSGLATAARALVERVQAVDASVPVACMLTAMPGHRRVLHAAVRAAGSFPWNPSLSDTVRLTLAHRALANAEALSAMANRLRQAAPDRRIIIEVDHVGDACEAVVAGFDIVEISGLPADDVAAVTRYARSAKTPVIVAASGYIDPESATDLVHAGARMLASTWPSAAMAPPVDITFARGR